MAANLARRKVETSALPLAAAAAMTGIGEARLSRLVAGRAMATAAELAALEGLPDRGGIERASRLFTKLETRVR